MKIKVEGPSDARLYICAMNDPLSRAERGVLRPDLLPVAFRRLAPAESISGLVRWWWFSSWDLPHGQSATQQILAFPSSNVVVEPHMVGISGPTTKSSTRTLEGSGWAVAALLQPAAVPAVVGDPARYRDSYRALAAPGLLKDVGESVAKLDVEAAFCAFEHWLTSTVGPVSSNGLLANAVMERVESDPPIRNVTEWAGAAHVSVRTLHRLTAKHVGLTPLAIIRRRRLQDAAHELRATPAPVGAIAVRMGYADQSHFTREFRATFGTTPSDYRRTAHTL
ncbi:AraC family transcriptional regulator [Corynebacterium sanguinis]|uniref:AraC family transcriptional regulator n=2 Tax=Corynebacterium sanguinis TaxID=2594913 RepID=A0A6C1TVE9_9CORY|nr:AraC family transcriptional regulator [Corynebacterium sanguinis]TVS22226.1 AraC family transcriptional regulator [Corynebacterium sanguinis]TVS24754.1 AraC family transcriptional regulator [Corynebacterium sanguinis]TVS25575.1 AraC family transcriptional regulator [Corynebacterium sanguinis]TVS27264.1 AraC family transcriptional regulator [Corynebacterium sanguinis]